MNATADELGDQLAYGDDIGGGHTSGLPAGCHRPRHRAAARAPRPAPVGNRRTVPTGPGARSLNASVGVPPWKSTALRSTALVRRVAANAITSSGRSGPRRLADRHLDRRAPCPATAWSAASPQLTVSTGPHRHPDTTTRLRPDTAVNWQRDDTLGPVTRAGTPPCWRPALVVSWTRPNEENVRVACGKERDHVGRGATYGSD